MLTTGIAVMCGEVFDGVARYRDVMSRKVMF